MESGNIASWSLSEGDSFGPGDVFCSVETDKATVDFEAQDDGVLAKILVPAGSDEIPCGKPIMVIVEDEDDVAAFKDFTVTDDTPAPVAPSETPAEAAAPVEAPTVATSTPAPAATPASTGDRVVASPLAHMLSKESGLDISQIKGTGPGGRIIAADVREFVPTAEQASPAVPVAAAPSAAPIPGVGFTDFPVSNSEIPARLAQSKRNVPHYYLTVDVTVDNLLDMRSTLNAAAGDDGPKIGVYEFLIKAAALSMRAVPSANASWMDSFVRVFDQVDMNVVVGHDASATRTPVIADAGRKGLKAIASELDHAVNNDDVPSSLGTFTILNLGMYGVKSCAPIITEPQSCALAIGALETRIVPNDDPEADSIYKESVVFTATLSCDHRVVDGAVGAQWLQAFQSHVENPHTLML